MRGDTSAREVLDAFISQRTDIDTVQEMFPGAEQDGRDGQVQLVNNTVQHSSATHLRLGGLRGLRTFAKPTLVSQTLHPAKTKATGCGG